MFDIGFWEVAIIGVIMLLVLGPERLPGVARTAGFWLGKFRKTINQVKAEIKNEMDAAELNDLKDVKEQINKARQGVTKQAEDFKKNVENESKSISEKVRSTEEKTKSGDPAKDKNNLNQNDSSKSDNSAEVVTDNRDLSQKIEDIRETVSNSTENKKTDA